MGDQPPDLTDAVEVSDLRATPAASPTLLDTRRPLLTPRQRMRRLAVACGSVLLALLILIAAAPGLRAGAGSWLAGFVPTPTATLPPGSDRFYFIASVPDSQLSIDGHSVPHLPRIGADPPLVLARGQHHLSWKAQPFLPQSCVLSVPFNLIDTCGALAVLSGRQSAIAGFIVLLRESLAALPTGQQGAVIAAVQSALASFTSNIQPGDHYFLQTATQPLRGTLSFQLDTADAPGVDAACGPYNLAPFAICTVSPDVCTMFCTIPAPALANVGVAVTRSSWYVITLASLSFRLSALSGQTLLANGPISPGGQAVVDFGIFLTLTWDGVAWHVQPAFGPASDALFQRLTLSTANTQLLTAPGCAAMPDFIGPNAGISGPFDFAFIQAANPADGCLAVLSTPPGSGTQKAYYLYRFGGLVAINDLAHHLDPRWPVASPHERQIAAAILSSGTPRRDG